MSKEIGGIPLIFGDPHQPKALDLSLPKAGYVGFQPGSEILPKGLIRRAGCKPLPCDILYERDIAVKLRDGVTVYVDVFRPVLAKGSQTKAPAIVASSPYGKEPGKGNQVLDDFPFRMGVPLSRVSELQKWEGPDPGYWVQYGYSVVNPDSRGVGDSEGDIYQWGTQEGRDGADIVDWVGSQSWCNGKVATSGNSWLAISSWFIAAENPRHLACIAPWEGFSGGMENTIHGGVISPNVLAFQLNLICVNAGRQSWENAVAMLKKYPDWNAYWDDKRAKVEKIDVPTYVAASYGNPVHTYGTFNTWCRLKTKQKWLRVHDSWEWPDYYSDSSVSDLHLFYDHFLKDIDNGWENTPTVRYKILETCNPSPLTGHTLTSSTWPPAEAIPVKFYLDPGNETLDRIYPSPSEAKYKALDESLVFWHEFSEDMIMAGPITMNLVISLQGSSDADIFINIEKVLPNGTVPWQCKVPFDLWYQRKLITAAHELGISGSVLWYSGSIGRIRVSRREIDESVSVPGLPIQRFDISKPVREGERVVVAPNMNPVGWKFSKGERMRVKIDGQDTAAYPPTDKSPIPLPEVENPNKDVEITVYGGQEDRSGSYVIFPFIKA